MKPLHYAFLQFNNGHSCRPLAEFSEGHAFRDLHVRIFRDGLLQSMLGQPWNIGFGVLLVVFEIRNPANVAVLFRNEEGISIFLIGDICSANSEVWDVADFRPACDTVVVTLEFWILD